MFGSNGRAPSARGMPFECGGVWTKHSLPSCRDIMAFGSLLCSLDGALPLCHHLTVRRRAQPSTYVTRAGLCLAADDLGGQGGFRAATVAWPEPAAPQESLSKHSRHSLFGSSCAHESPRKGCGLFVGDASILRFYQFADGRWNMILKCTACSRRRLLSVSTTYSPMHQVSHCQHVCDKHRMHVSAHAPTQPNAVAAIPGRRQPP